MTFGILGFFQKTNERIQYFCLTVLKTNLFVCFLEESEDTKKSFRNYLTFKKNTKSMNSKLRNHPKTAQIDTNLIFCCIKRTQPKDVIRKDFGLVSKWAQEKKFGLLP